MQVAELNGDNLNIKHIKGKSITLHGKDGKLQNVGGEPMFYYIEDGKFIGISAPTTSLIEEIIH